MSLVMLQFNSSVLESSTVDLENKVYLTAFSLADDLIEEIKQKAFDANTINFPTTDPTDLTSAYALGKGWWEVYPNFNDIDDFNYYVRSVSAPHAEKYKVSCRVYYVDPDDPDRVVWTQTFYKKVVISVSSPYMRKSIDLSFVFTLK